MPLSNNISHLRTLKKLSQEQLAIELGITRSRLGAYEENRNEPPIAMLIKISEYFHVAIDALLKGDLRKTHPDALIKVGKNRLLFPVMLDKENNEQIEVITEKASAGYLNGHSDPEFMEKLPMMKLPFKTIGKQRAFPIKGDSMLPVKPGSFVIGKYIEHATEITEGNTYILLTKNDGLVYKRVYKMKQNLMLHSDNQSYAPYAIKQTEVLEIWEFVCSIDSSDKKQDEANLENIVGLIKELQNDIKKLS